MILNIENLQNSTKILLEHWINLTVTGYKINVQKLLSFKHTNSKVSEIEIRKQFSLEQVSKVTLGINLTKGVKD